MGKEPPTGSHQITFGWYVRRWCVSSIFNRGPKFWHWNHHTIFPAEVLTHRSCKKAVRKLVWNPLDLWWHEGSNSHPSIAPRVVIFDHHGSSRSAAHQAEASRLQMGSVLGMSRGLFLAYSPKNERKTVKPENHPLWISSSKPPISRFYVTFRMFLLFSCCCFQKVLDDSTTGAVPVSEFARKICNKKRVKGVKTTAARWKLLGLQKKTLPETNRIFARWKWGASWKFGDSELGKPSLFEGRTVSFTECNFSKLV